jgi:hypothetical protein
LKGNLHIVTQELPMANVLLSVLHMLGHTDLQTFGDSTGALDLNRAPEATSAQGA